MKKTFSKSGLFLIEFMIVLLFFSISATVCVSVFMKADSLNKRSNEKNQALFLVQSTAETIKTFNFSDMSNEKLTNSLKQQSYYDEDWQPCEKTDSYKYILSVDTSEDDSGMFTAQISVSEAKDVIYHLEVKKYIPEGKSHV